VGIGRNRQPVERAAAGGFAFLDGDRLVLQLRALSLDLRPGIRDIRDNCCLRSRRDIVV
jgi:hypothetical protein